MKRKIGRFTLLEVVVSLAILAIGLAGFLQLMMGSQKRIARSVDRWTRMHMLTQAAEYFMLQNEDPGGIPEQFFPYPGYQAVAYYEEAEGLPEEFNNLEGQLPLKQLVIELRKEGKVLDKLVIDRISYESTAAGE